VQVGYAPAASFALPAARVALEELEIRGCRAASRRDLEEALAATARGAVTPVIGHVRPLHEAQAALEDLAAGHSVGRQVLAVSDA
jgi:D-arabinose 1-dehydrogenase-like Zn-dependent alcohol dehydrogenase